MLFYPIGTTEACSVAAAILKASGFSLIDHLAPEVTHLLLDIPSFSDDGTLRGGGEIAPLLRMLPSDIVIIGGNLRHSSLSGYRCLDLLQDPFYLAENAFITADCAIKVVAPLLKTTFRDSSCLIIGWGRISKCLGALLKALDCSVTIAARKASDRAMAAALGHSILDIPEIPGNLSRFDLVCNTVPELILSESPPQECLCLELASKPGIAGDQVISARGLPGKYAPLTAGKLIARRIRTLCEEDAL